MNNVHINSAAPAPGIPVVAVLGDGQLARMMHTAAIELGQTLRLLAASPDSSAAQVCADVIVGDYTDLETLRNVCQGADAVTFDHEHVPNEHLETLIAEGYNVQPKPDALIYAQDKLLMRQKLESIGAPVPPFAAIDTVGDAEKFFDRVHGEVCLKTRRGGYDGKGVWFPASREELTELVTKLLDDSYPLMAEKKLNFSRELSAMVARTPSGEVLPWPVAESVQSGGVCVETIAPAPEMGPTERRYCEELAMRIADELQVTGVLAVELFEYRRDNGETAVAVNELAMRPHNTGHWTQDGCVTSQFEQHLRAVLDLPLGSTTPVKPVTVMANTLGGEKDPDQPVYERFREVWDQYPQAKIHWYGKEYRPGRKLGHVTVVGEDVETVRREAKKAAEMIVKGA